ncbi:MAG: hypothetical protein ACE5J3_11870 [Methanosarcinales archaeon]
MKVMSSEWKKVLEKARKVIEGLDKKTFERVFPRADYTIRYMKNFLRTLETAERGGIVKDWNTGKELKIPKRGQFELALFIINKYRPGDIFTEHQVEEGVDSYLIYQKLQGLVNKRILKSRVIEELDEKWSIVKTRQYTPTEMGVGAIKKYLLELNAKREADAEIRRKRIKKKTGSISRKTKPMIGTKSKHVTVTEKVKPIKVPGKFITEQDLSFYEGSGIDFRHLLNSGDHVIRSWAQELYTLRKDIEDRDAYISQLKELHSKVSNYHSEKCRGKPPTNCAWTCDVWKLLHLCLYLMDESN